MVTAQLTPAGARLVDAPLTEAARGYKNGMMVCPMLFPEVDVMARGGQVITFGAEDFVERELRRAPGADIAGIDIGYTGEKFALDQRALEVRLPIELEEEAMTVPRISLGVSAAIKGRKNTDLQVEIEAARLAQSDDSYPAANIETLVGGARWSNAASKPADNIETAKAIIRRGIGMNPNTLVVGAEVHDKLRNNADVIDRVKHTAAPGDKGTEPIITKALLAAYFGVENYVVGEAMKGEPGAFEHIWGKFAILTYTTVGTTNDMGEPTWGYTYRLAGYPVVEQPYYFHGRRSWNYPYVTENTPIVVGKPAGYLFKTVVD